MEGLRRRLLYIALAIAAVLAVGTGGFVLLEDYPLFDAFYMSLITIATVGYSEIHPLSQTGRVFNSFLMFFGVGVMFLAIGAVTQSVIQLELGDVIGKRRMKRMIDKLDKHYLVCGFGRVGRGAAAEFQRAGVPFLVIDQDESKVDRAVRTGYLAVVGDSTNDEVLKEGGIMRARGVVASLATDADNLFLVLSAKTLNPMVNVSARVNEEEAEQKLRRVGADVILRPYRMTGYRLAQSLLRPHVTEFLDFTTQNLGLDVSIEQVKVSGSSELAGKSLAQVQVRRELGVIVLAIRRAGGQMLFNPPADAVIAAGDYLIAMGEAANLRQLERRVSEVGGQ
jgi:voltage-gated potassium channel